MKTNLNATLLAVLLSATALAEAPEDTEAQTVWGTTDLHLKGVFLIDYNACASATFSPLCPPWLSARGRTYYDLDDWNDDADDAEGRYATIWVEMVHGALPPEAGGFGILVCSDLDDNNLCSNVGGNDDAVAIGFANDGPLPPEACSKDEKDCGDPTAAEVTLCVPVDDDDSFDDLGVFLTLWADAELESNLGVGVSEGFYEVYLTPGAFVDDCPDA